MFTKETDNLKNKLKDLENKLGSGQDIKAHMDKIDKIVNDLKLNHTEEKIKNERNFKSEKTMRERLEKNLTTKL